MWTDDMKRKVSEANKGKGHPRSVETRVKIGIGSRATRLGEVKPCPYGCGVETNNGSMVRHIRSAHEFVCSYPGCPETKHKANGYCLKHHGTNSNLKKRGLTLDEYLERYDNQSGECAICRKPGTRVGDFSRGREDVLAVDHSHSTGSTRGLLCLGCNVALGHFQDNVDLLKAATDYLRSWNE